jgi:RAD51-like protein 2
MFSSASFMMLRFLTHSHGNDNEGDDCGGINSSSTSQTQRHNRPTERSPEVRHFSCSSAPSNMADVTRRCEPQSIPNVPLVDLPLRPSALTWWHQKGFRSTMEVQQGLFTHADGSMLQWAEDLDATSVGALARLYREVQEALEANYARTQATATASTTPTTRGSLFVRGRTAAEILQQQQQQHQAGSQPKAIVSFCRKVDQLLGGGIALGELTELCGPPGIGKTQWAMQLAVNVQIPAFFGGVAGKTIYIDTEGSLTPERCHDMARHLVQHVTTKHSKTQQVRPEVQDLPDWFTPEGLLEGIQVLRVYDVATLDATLSTLEKLCRQPPDTTERPIRLIVVDSLAFPVRAESTSDFIGRTQQLTQWAMKLSQLASRSPLPKAVVVLNQMTTTAGGGPEKGFNNKENSLSALSGGSSTLTPALGEAWAHAVTNRLVLAESSEGRICQLVKSPRLPSGRALFSVVEGGIRDVARVGKRPRTSDSTQDSNAAH